MILSWIKKKLLAWKECAIRTTHEKHALNPLAGCPHWDTCPQTPQGTCRAVATCRRSVEEQRFHRAIQQLRRSNTWLIDESD